MLHTRVIQQTDQNDCGYGNRCVLPVAQRNKILQIVCSNDCEPGGGAGANNEQLGPAKKKTDSRAERTVKINIFTTGMRKPRAKLGIYQTADYHERSNHQPKHDHRGIGIGIGGDNLRCRVNPRTNRDADE